MNILTKPVAEMTVEEALQAAKIGRLSFEPVNSCQSSVKYYNALPPKEVLLAALEKEPEDQVSD